MIRGLPESKDLESAGIGYLCTAFSEVLSLLHAESFFTESALEEDRSATVRKYWDSVRAELSTHASLVHTGVELILKARIAEISPYLLLDRPMEWPGGCATTDKDFDDFHTIGAQLLPKILNTVSCKRLDAAAIAKIEDIRKRRNKIVHAASRQAIPTVLQLIDDILEVSRIFFGACKWPEVYRTRTQSQFYAEYDYHDQIAAGLIYDFTRAIDLLTPAKVKEHFGIGKKQRRYHCPDCRLGDLEIEAPIAVLRPNKPSSTTLWCIACGSEHEVEAANPNTHMDCSCVAAGASPNRWHRWLERETWDQ